MKKSAFTMIELVFVIIVLGILASIAMDSIDRDLKQEASDTILSQIRLAQQLALNDNKHLPNSPDNWQKAYWRFEYRKCNGVPFLSSRVGSDINRLGSINKSESAIDPINGKYLFTNGNCSDLVADESPNVSILRKAGVKSVIRSGGCSGSGGYIAFDYLGRPHHGNYNQPYFQNIMTTDCNMTFQMSTDQDNDGINDSFTITIEAETGHSFIVGAENS
jgi:prepilin-type N-terminal cleavage/methylation domain-containing protein